MKDRNLNASGANLASRSPHLAQAKADLDRIVNTAFKSDISTHMELFYKKWKEKGEEKFVEVFKEKYGELNFFRGKSDCQ